MKQKNKSMHLPTRQGDIRIYTKRGDEFLIDRCFAEFLGVIPEKVYTPSIMAFILHQEILYHMAIADLIEQIKDSLHDN